MPVAKKTARGREGVNKSQEIRNYLSKAPGAMPKQIIADLGAKGIKVSAALVSAIKYTKKKVGKGRKKAGRKAAVGNNSLTVTELLKAKALADQLGGAARAKTALDTLEKLK